MFCAVDENGNRIYAKDYKPGIKVYSPHNKEEMIYVKEHYRIWQKQHVRAHFRFKKGSKEHALRDYHPLKEEALDFLIKKLEAKYHWENDKPFKIDDLEYAVDLYFKDMNTGQEFVVDVNVDKIPAKETQKKIEYFSKNEIAYLILLSAAGKKNDEGKFFRDSDIYGLKVISGNELALLRNYSICNYYFDHDNNSIIKVFWDTESVREVEKAGYYEYGEEKRYRPERILYKPKISGIYDDKSDLEIVLIKTRVLDSNGNYKEAEHLKGALVDSTKQSNIKNIVIHRK